MSYYLRLLSPSAARIPPDAIEANVLSDFNVDLEFEPEGDDWETLEVRMQDGATLAVVERSEVGDGTLGAEEIDELREEVRDGKPESAARWLDAYLARVRTVSAIASSAPTSSRAASPRPHAGFETDLLAAPIERTTGPKRGTALAHRFGFRRPGRPKAKASPSDRNTRPANKRRSGPVERTIPAREDVQVRRAAAEERRGRRAAAPRRSR